MRFGWDLLEPSKEERDLLQEGLGQNLATFLELRILKRLRFAKMKMAYIYTLSFIAKMKMVCRLAALLYHS